MSDSIDTFPEQQAAVAFSRQAPIFDEIYGHDAIIQYKREQVRNHVLHYLPASSHILELNAGTGEDAIFFARHGHTVHATDISDAMQARLKEKAAAQHLLMNISDEVCSFTELDKLSARGPYDLVFSNFAGLNCTNDLAKVLHSLDGLLKPGGYATLVILPRFCLWETLLLFKGKWRTGFRRFRAKHGAPAHIEGAYFRCWYYDPSFVRKHTRDRFNHISTEGLCTIVPPSYLAHFAENHPRLFAFLQKQENRFKRSWPWRSIGDYYIITLQKKS